VPVSKGRAGEMDSRVRGNDKPSIPPRSVIPAK
jgi:hypothetical protein